jgi:hypothetical protein
MGRVTAVTDTHVVLYDPPDAPFSIPLSHIEYGVVKLEFK